MLESIDAIWSANEPNLGTDTDTRAFSEVLLPWQFPAVGNIADNSIADYSENRRIDDQDGEGGNHRAVAAPLEG